MHALIFLFDQGWLFGEHKVNNANCRRYQFPMGIEV